jgi:SPP1 family phage portal protein
MIFLNKDIELTEELLQKMINRYTLNVEPKLIKYKNYYDGIQEILKKTYADETKPCNRTVINYCKNIVDSYCGYLATPQHISYRSNDDIEDIMNVLKYNDYQDEDSDFLKDALIYGVANELMYNDKDGETRFRLISPIGSFGVFDDSLTGDLLYFVRMYKVSEWDDSDDYNVDVYTDNFIKHYSMSGKNGNLIFKDEEKHYFNQCPANIFYLPEEKSIFDCILSQQDSLNEIVSAEIDDFSAFCDAYLVLTGGVDVDADDIATMKENRVLLLPEGVVASWLTKNASDTQVENIIKRLHDSIYRVAQCPDFSSESFVGGVSSGIAIQYRLTGMETRAGKIEAKMKKALQRRIELICGVASLTIGEDIFRDVEIDFKRNIPADINSTIQVINALKGVVSDKTLLSQLDFVGDVDAELEAVQAQKEANMELYGFGVNDTEDEEEEVGAE